MVMGKDGASQLESQENKYRSAGICKRGTRHVVNNHKKKEDLDRTYSESTKLVKGWDDRGFEGNRRRVGMIDDLREGTSRGEHKTELAGGVGHQGPAILQA